MFTLLGQTFRQIKQDQLEHGSLPICARKLMMNNEEERKIKVEPDVREYIVRYILNPREEHRTEDIEEVLKIWNEIFD